MTGRSNSAATSRMMWMLSASSARRWSSCGGAVLTLGSNVDVCIRQPKKKSPDVFARAFDPSAWLSGILDVRDYANGRIESAGTLRVLQQQHAHARPRTNITAEDVYHLGAGKSIGASAWTRGRARRDARDDFTRRAPRRGKLRVFCLLHLVPCVEKSTI